jgi:hypothetical protein
MRDLDEENDDMKIIFTLIAGCSIGHALTSTHEGKVTAALYALCLAVFCIGCRAILAGSRKEP